MWGVYDCSTTHKYTVHVQTHVHACTHIHKHIHMHNTCVHKHNPQHTQSQSM